MVAWCCSQSRGEQAPRAPVFDATRLHEPQILQQTWLVQSGDDASWARPDFDDSNWMRFDPSTSIVKVYGSSRPRVMWYRMHMQVDPKSSGLALSELNISHAFEVFANGERLMASGGISPFVPYTMTHRLLASIPDRMAQTGNLVIAVRAGISPTEWSDTQNPGYYANNLSIGQYNTLASGNWLDVIGQNALFWLDHLLLISVGIVAIVLFVDQRRQRQYLWIAALGGLIFLETPFPVVTVFHNVRAYWQIIADLPRLASPFIWTSLYFSFVNQRIGWRWRAFLVVAGVCNFLSAVQPYLFHVPSVFMLFGNLPFAILLAGVIPITLGVHWWRGNREAGILLIPAVLLSLTIYAQAFFYTMFQFPATRATAISGLQLIQEYRVGPFTVSLNTVSDMLSAIALAIIILLRSSSTSRVQAQMEAELEAAKQVQHVLVPDEICAFPEFAIESVYEPALQVGGDFFQVLKAEAGGALVVVGDVAGKGLPAAMLVSVIVGLIRGFSEYTRDPAELLVRLNEHLIGRSGDGFSTALVALIGGDGWVSIANAGHLPPYLNGKEVGLPGALPLGVVAGAGYETTQFQMVPGSRLTFYSDGVVEAQNRSGELFGFERSREISMEPAAVIMEKAKSFGQQDDITVLTVERKAARTQAATPALHQSSLTEAVATD